MDENGTVSIDENGAAVIINEVIQPIDDADIASLFE